MEPKELALRTEYAELQKRLQDSEIFSSKEYPKLARRQSQLENLISLFDERQKLLKDKTGAEELKHSTSADLVEMAIVEVEDLENKLKLLENKLAEVLNPKDPNDERNAVIEIRAAAGGDEASLFAGELYRMYTRWAETHNYKVELIDESPSEAGGFKEIIFMVYGIDVYHNLKFEAGVHRVQRVPVTESQGRIHTSTVTVAVLPVY